MFLDRAHLQMLLLRHMKQYLLPRRGECRVPAASTSTILWSLRSLAGTLSNSHVSRNPSSILESLVNFVEVCHV